MLCEQSKSLLCLFVSIDCNFGVLLDIVSSDLYFLLAWFFNLGFLLDRLFSLGLLDFFLLFFTIKFFFFHPPLVLFLNRKVILVNEEASFLVHYVTSTEMSENSLEMIIRHIKFYSFKVSFDFFHLLEAIGRHFQKHQYLMPDLLLIFRSKINERIFLIIIILAIIATIIFKIIADLILTVEG